MKSTGRKARPLETLRLGRTLLLLETVVNNPALSWPAEMRRYGAGVLPLPLLAEKLRDLPKVTAGGELGF